MRAHLISKDTQLIFKCLIIHSRRYNIIQLITTINRPKVINKNGKPIILSNGLIIKLRIPKITPQVKYNLKSQLALTHSNQLNGKKYTIAKSIKELNNIDKNIFIVVILNLRFLWF